MLETATSWDYFFQVCLGGYIAFSALFFLVLFHASRRPARGIEGAQQRPQGRDEAVGHGDFLAAGPHAEA